jgi:hypothetical protein
MTDQDEMRKISLETYTVLKNIEKIKEFMFSDLDKTIELVHSDKGAPNFMLALVLCSYTEFWGKLMLPSGKDKECFEAFFRKLGTKYEEVMNDPNTNIYGRIRCGLVHEYLVKGSSKIVIEGGDCGITYNNKTRIYTFYIRRYLEDFKFAVNIYFHELRTNLHKFDEARKALEKEVQLL